MSTELQRLVSVLVVCLVLVTFASIASYALYWFDKRRAVNGGRRVPESTLHWVSILGGWPGAIIAQQRLRHKTQKQSFRLVFWFTVFVNIAAIALMVYLILTSTYR